jgi:hypothetical protein
MSGLGDPVNDRAALTTSLLDAAPPVAVGLFGFITPGAAGVGGTRRPWF